MDNLCVFTGHLEVGHAWGLDSPYRSRGAKLAIGPQSPTIPLGIVHVGMLLRLKYEWFYLEKTLAGPVLEMVLH